MTVLWVDASAGASGDMLLGALLGAGVPLEVLQTAVTAVSPEPVTLTVETVDRAGLAATRCRVRVADSATHRTWADVRTLIEGASLPEAVASLATRVFERLAAAEARVHGTDPAEVHFHEVGALDAIADVVGAAAGFAHLAADRVVVSPVAVGSGSVSGAHGALPVPPPAVVELLRGAPSYAGRPGAPTSELCTPTGAAVLTTVADAWGGQPAMVVSEVGVGAGGRDPVGYPNVLRLLVGAGTDEPDAQAHDSPALLVETNVDDLDPRVWPAVIAALLDAGAADAWLTPILMKKGRPAHTLSVLVRADRAAGVRSAIFHHTSTIGLREHPVAKHALERRMRSVRVGGQPIAVKLALEDGRVVNAQPEYDDVARAAAVLGRPVHDVLADAVGASRTLVWTGPDSERPPWTSPSSP